MEQLLFSNLVHLPVASLAEQKKIGQIIKVIVELDRFEVKGFLVKKHLFSAIWYVGFDEVVEIDKEALLVADSQVLVLPQEIVRVARILSQGFELIGMKVLTKRGQYLGRVADFSFDGASGRILQFYSTKFFQTRFIPRSKIVQVKKRALIVESDKELIAAPELA